jgi:ferric-dicitrate binding protein FerR (iron transport regulator)
MQNRDSYNKIEDFLSDESFQKWVKGNDDPLNWSEWTVENPYRAKLVEEARMWILAMATKESTLSNQETQKALQKVWKKIGRSNEELPFRAIWHHTWFRTAAAVFVVGLATFLYYANLSSPQNTTITYQELVKSDLNGLIEQTNNSDKPQLITLSDASSVLLQPNSKLSYPKIFTGNERKVYLSGEGFFEISKDPNRAFYVYANETVTKVFGTSFRVIAYANQPNVEVLVRTGKVKVSSNQNIRNASSEEIMLLPNQAARFMRKEQLFEKILDITQDKPLLAATNTMEQLSFDFKDIPVHQIFKTLEQAYLITIDFPQDKLKECYLTTSLIDVPLPEKLKIICESLGNNSRYEMNGNYIKIISNGCK